MTEENKEKGQENQNIGITYSFSYSPDSSFQNQLKNKNTDNLEDLIEKVSKRKISEDNQKKEVWENSLIYRSGFFFQNPYVVTYAVYSGIREKGDLVDKLTGMIPNIGHDLKNGFDLGVYLYSNSFSDYAKDFKNWSLNQIGEISNYLFDVVKSSVFGENKLGIDAKHIVEDSQRYFLFVEDFFKTQSNINNLLVLGATTVAFMELGRYLQSNKLREKLDSDSKLLKDGSWLKKPQKEDLEKINNKLKEKSIFIFNKSMNKLDDYVYDKHFGHCQYLKSKNPLNFLQETYGVQAIESTKYVCDVSKKVYKKIRAGVKAFINGN